MSRLALAATLGVALCLAACHTAQPSPQRFAQVIQYTPSAPNEAIAKIKSDVAARGWRIVDEGPDNVCVDFGTSVARIPVPTEYGLWGTRVSFRDTEVHGSAIYMVTPSTKGTQITMSNNPVYWHPDYKCWLPGPYDLSPGAELLHDYSEGVNPGARKGSDAATADGAKPADGATPAAPPKSAVAKNEPPVAVPMRASSTMGPKSKSPPVYVDVSRKAAAQRAQGEQAQGPATDKPAEPAAK